MTALTSCLLLLLGVLVALTTPPLSGGTIAALVLIGMGGVPLIDRMTDAYVDDSITEEEL